MAGRLRRLEKLTAAVGVAGWLLLAAGSDGQPPQQPIPYSHKVHLALGLTCDLCHKNADPGEYMGFPQESFCMTCHQAIKADSPHIAKLAAAARDQKPMPWVRIYQLPPRIYFSHRVHTTAGTTCETCHGPVRDRDVMSREVSYDMKSCMACHAAMKARNDCAACHEEH
jgi:c(7)-type cytochrome triheme protein